MRLYTFLITFAVFFVFLAQISYAADDRLFVGVSPPIVDLGEVERGTTNVVKFYAVTVSEDSLLIYLKCENGRLDFFNSRYTEAVFNYSEENTAVWVRFLGNPVELRPQNETIKTSYESIKGWREVSFLLEVPMDAEPGYHLIKVTPTPAESGTTPGTVGTRIIAVTSVNVIFKVPGAAERKGVILDTVAEGYNGNNLGINTYFKNTGTDTITAKAIQRVYDMNDSFVNEIYSSTEYIRPKEVKSLNSSLPLTGLSLSDYKVFTSVSYTTDSSYKNSTISISRLASQAAHPQEDFSTLVLISIILVIAIAIYRWVH